MSQADYNLADAAAVTFRADLNAQLDAIATLNSGTGAPSPTFANQWWFDSTNELLKVRDADNTTWVTVASKTATAWVPYVNGDALGTTAALDELGLELPSQAEAEAGAATTARRWTAQRVAQAIDALAPGGGGDARVYGTGITLDPYAAEQDLSQAHGLGANPDGAEVYLECVINQFGWTVGQRYHPKGAMIAPSYSILWSTTTLYLRTRTLTRIVSKNFGGVNNMTPANWKMVVTPYLHA